MTTKITHEVKSAGTGNATVGDLRKLLAEIEGRNVPDTAAARLYMSDPDRPGEQPMWSISITWADDASTEVSIRGQH